MALVRPSMVVERKPLSLPPPKVFAPQATHTTLQNAQRPPLLPMPPTPPPPPFDPTAPLPTLEDVRAQLRKEGSPNLEPWDLDAPVSPGGVAATPPPVGRKTRDANELPHFGARRAANYDFIYADRDSFENELNEFYNFQDRPQIMEGKALFEATFKGQWKSAKPSYRGNYIGCLLEQMELRDPEPRYTAVRKLLYISQGVFGEVSTEAEHRQRIVENNQLIFQMGALDYVFAALKVVSLTLDAITRAGEPQIPPIERQFAMDLANSEITAYMCLLGLMIEVNSDDERFATEITNTNPPMASYLFTLVAQLAEGNRKHYPVKKLLLLLWKVLILSLGTTQQLTDLKSASRTLEGLPHFAEDSFVKSTPQDYHNFHLVAATRYPAYVTPNANSLCPPKLQLAEPIPTCIRRQLQQPAVLQPYINMDIVLPTTFQESVELYRKHNYVSLASVQIARERDRFEKEEEHKDVNGHSEMEEFVDALDDEAMSASHLGSERRRDVYALRPSVKRNLKRIRKQDATGLKRLENLYRHLLPQMSTHIGMLIRLLYYVNLGANNAAPLGVGRKPDGEATTPGSEKPSNGSTTQMGEDGQSPDGNTPICEMTLDQKREHLMRADNNRHKEVVTKAVSGILLILLKALKCHHALKFEYVSQLLVDNNCAILILKMLSTWLQSPTAPPPSHPDIPNPTDAPGSSSWGEKPTTSKPPFNMGMGANWLMKKEEPAELDFFHFCRAEDPLAPEGFDTQSPTANTDDNKSGPSGPTTTTGQDKSNSAIKEPGTRVPSSFRNFYTSINLLRILQKLTKRKTHRVLALVQWKASAVLKRAIKINHIGLQLYALKLLKSQIPYLGKKWRSSNMKVITAIFLHLRPCLRDDYLAGDVDVDVDEALAHEQKLRSLISSYHDHRYPDANGISGPANSEGADDENAASPHVDELDLILSISRRASYEGAMDPQIHHMVNANSLRSSLASEQLILDPNFMENYEEWLRMEVYESEGGHSPSSSPIEGGNQWTSSDKWDLGEIGGNINSTPAEGRSLFSATRRFSKEMLSDEYDDTEWSWDVDDTDSTSSYYADDFYMFGGQGSNSVWDEHVDAPMSPEDDPSGQWAWTRPIGQDGVVYVQEEEDLNRDPDLMEEEYEVNSEGKRSRSSGDSGVGSWVDGERDDDPNPSTNPSDSTYLWPDEIQPRTPPDADTIYPDD